MEDGRRQSGTNIAQLIVMEAVICESIMRLLTDRTELRKDPTSGRWVLLRCGISLPGQNGVCSFCPGHEAEVPPEIAAYRTNGQPPNSSEWLVRVVPERTPLLRIEGDIQRDGTGVFDRVSGRGASEIVIEHPDHWAVWDHLPTQAVERVLWMYRERLEDLYRDTQIRAVLIRRRESRPVDRPGHPISRILGVPIIFDDLRRELAAARHYFSYKQRCLYCDILRQERGEGARVIEETSHFLVYAPYGAHHPFETWLVPTTHHHRFEAAASEEMRDLACALQSTYRRLHAALSDAPVELTLHTAPNAGMRLREDEWQSLSEDYHWHIELSPHLGTPMDVGGFAVNSVPPEDAAKRLRGVR
jgi:UDPglucose--hexose-1-phosphate uridylyltransferase